MQPYQHVIASSIISGGLYIATRSPEMSILSFVTGFMIDVDHIIDYWREHNFRMDYEHFFDTCERYGLKKVYLWFHSLEFLLSAAVISVFSGSAILAGICIGWFQHMVFDFIFNDVKPMGYFILYRWKKGFLMGDVFDVPPQHRQDTNTVRAELPSIKLKRSKGQ